MSNGICIVEDEGTIVGKVATHLAMALSCVADQQGRKLELVTTAFTEMDFKREQRRFKFSEIMLKPL